MRVRHGRACHGELEKFNQGDLLTYLLDSAGERERLVATKAGVLLERLTRYHYVKTLAFWVDATKQGKVVSKLFQRSGLLLSEVTSGVEDSNAEIAALEEKPGSFMTGLAKDFDAVNQTLYGRELSGVVEGEKAYEVMLTNTPNSIVEYMNERFCSILQDEVLKASCIFEHLCWPSFTTAKLTLEAHGEKEIDLLLGHYKVLYGYLGGDAMKARSEWRRLKLFVGRSESLITLSYLELYTRLFNQKSEKFILLSDGSPSDKLDDQSFYNILLLVTIVMTYAVGTSVCERGFALMNNLKTARRSRMRNLLLRTLMTICELGKEWEDPKEIPVDDMIDEWRAQSKRGRYKAAMWQAAGLQVPSTESTSAKGGTSSTSNNEDMAAHGEEHAAFREAMGLTPDDYRPGPHVIPGATPAAPI